MFFKDEKKAEIVEKKYNVDIEKIDCPFVIEKPTNLAINDKIIAHKMSGKGLMSRLKRLITNENIEKNDPNVIHGYCRIIIPVREVINQITYKFLKTDDLASIKDKKYIFFGFHKQPEASIDVCGRYFENQFENVINLWRQLPPDWYLIVKEHSNAIGDRSFNFFRKLRKYPRIILMNEKEDSHELIRNAQLIATNTGTMALEAALMDVPSITLSQVFFNKLNYCRHCTWIDFEKYDSVIDLITEIKSTPNNIEEYREFIMKNSFEGIITDIVTYPDVMNPNNIEKIVNAFTAIIK
jgi:predicted glycosyltransferase